MAPTMMLYGTYSQLSSFMFCNGTLPMGASPTSKASPASPVSPASPGPRPAPWLLRRVCGGHCEDEGDQVARPMPMPIRREDRGVEVTSSAFRPPPPWAIPLCVMRAEAGSAHGQVRCSQAAIQPRGCDGEPGQRKASRTLLRPCSCQDVHAALARLT